jgi:hypothetical protein
MVLIALVIMGLPILWLMGGPYTTTFPRSFDQGDWKAAAPAAYPDDDARCGMIADLQYRVGVVGKTRIELVELLGEPEPVSYAPTRSYWLLCPSFLDIWVLDVRWEHGRAVEASVHDT